jgi:ketosteroid isomerase-like protein
VSAENVEKARTFYPREPLDLAELFSRPEAAERLESQFGVIFHPDFETRDSSAAIDPGKGFEGFVEGFRDWFAAFDSWRVSAEEILDAGDKVLVLLDIVARSRTDRVELPQRGANVLTFRDDRISRVELYLDQAEARRAAGLSDG